MSMLAPDCHHPALQTPGECWKPWPRLLWAASLLLLVACGRAPEAPSAPTSDTAIEAPSGFAVAAVNGEASDGRPALTVRFTRPLAQAQDLGQFLKVTDSEGKAVDGAWITDDGERIARFPHVKAQQEFTVEVLPGVVAADGSTLTEGLTRKVQSVDLPPAAGFASQGSILPSIGTDGLPIVSVNINEVDVEFFKVRAESLPRFLSEFQGGGRRGYWDLDQLKRIADSVYLNRFVINASANERKVSHLPVHQIAELEAPGVYFAVLKQSGQFDSQFQTTYFVRSDIGIHSRVHGDKLWVATRSLADGEALSGVEVSILDANGAVVVKGVSDGDGMLELNYRINTRHVLVGHRGEQMSMLGFNQPALDLSDFDVAGNTAAELSVFLWSGRDLYRPGETLRVSALLRDYDGRPIQGEQPLFATLRQPDGRPYASSQLLAAKGGYYAYEKAMTSDAPTGRWRLDVSPDPAGERAVYGYNLRIEEFLPERMKLNLDSTQTALKPGDALEFSVEGAYLYGAPAAGNRFTGKLSYAVDTHPVEGLKGYVFGDPVNPPNQEPVDAVDTALDAAGELQQSLELQPGTVAGPIAVTLFGSLYESGGRPVSRILKRTLWPAPQLVAVRPLFDPENLSGGQEARFEVLKVDAQGQRVAASGLQARLIREDRDYNWTYDNALGWRVDFTQRFVEVEQRSLDLPGESPGSIGFNVQWGPYRLEITDPATGLITRYPFTAGWSYDDDNRGVDARPDKVKLALDKSSYRAGDRLTLTVTPPHDGPGLLLVESDQLIQSQSFNARAGVELKLEVAPTWERHDVYITALVFRPGTAADKITPSRAVGIVHVPIDRSDRSIAVAVSAPERIRPQEALKVSVSAPDLAGQDAFVTVSAVDQGILNITRFEVPDAVKFFFGKRRYAVEAYDLYGRIIEALAGERARLKFGGDMAVPGLPQARRPTAKVLTVDLYSGPIALDAAGKAEISLPVPDFNGALRVSALAFGKDRYGSASTETLVRAPVVAEVSTPRVMAPGDRAVLTLDLQNLSGATQTLDVQFEADSPIAIDDASRRVSLADNARTTLRFPLRALGDIGVGKFRLQVRGGAIGLDRDWEIAVRSPYAPERRSRVEQLTGPGSVDLGVSTQGLLPASVRSRASVSTRVPLPIGRLIGELMEYPYGCIEQTTSKGYPYVLLDEAGSKALGIASLDPEKRRTNVQYAIDRIASMQLDNGHFSFWPGSSDYSDPLMTPYVVEFLQDAAAAGFTVPARVLQKSLERLREDLLSGGVVAWERVWGDPANHVRLAFNAHAALVLARVNQAPLGTLRNIYDNNRNEARGPVPLMRLAVALKMSGDQERAAAAAKLALGKRYARNNDYWGDYYTALGDRAEALALAVTHGFLADDQGARLLKLGQEAQASRWIGTHDALALLKLGKALSGSGGSLSGQLLIGGIAEGFASAGWFTRDLVIEDLRAGASLQIDSKSRYYLVQDTVGIPENPPAASSNGVRIQSQWYRHDGSVFTGDTLKEGEGLVVHIKVQASERMPDTLVEAPLPGGLEIENLNLMDSKQLADLVIEGTNLDEWRSYSANVRFQEYREDRFVAAVSLEQGGEVDLYYLVRAVSPGEYLIPAPYVEDMYRPELRAQGAPSTIRLKVVAPTANTP
ncbi:MAG: alpha-2-macroglobulin family protein [Rhodanobacteraceae bacterium]|nr:alpha-2-macroglobulin family protein [Rhodanobacteraceae bacterium]